MSAEENIATIKRAFKAFNDRDMSIIPQLVTPEFVRHDLTKTLGDLEGVEGVDDLFQLTFRALPDFHSEINDMFATESCVAVRFTVSGTHKGEFLGVAPTGKKVSYSGINLYRMHDGKCTETWQLMDVAGFLRQIGAITF